jgi:hypothetical protein
LNAVQVSYRDFFFFEEICTITVKLILTTSEFVVLVSSTGCPKILVRINTIGMLYSGLEHKRLHNGFLSSVHFLVDFMLNVTEADQLLHVHVVNAVYFIAQNYRNFSLNLHYT